ncbi:DUF3576 domain-containing protein [Lacibacterium aquatile]|uniref:DUF3576 domain-containing protein n=1 Tax=Lacibacterium aquatile TaxID=1168082 RepID=A0ABW5DRI1_9PROT
MRLAFVVLMPVFLAACGGSGLPRGEANFPQSRDDRERQTYGSILGDEGLTLFGGRDRARATQGQGIGVNTYLWRASLDTIGFMPLTSADPFGGVIITDWYSAPDSPSERFKVTLYVLDQDLRADGIRAAVFRQTRDGAGNWADSVVDPKTGPDIENAILTRARQIRLDAQSKK